MELNIEFIKKVLPHRYPLLLVDRLIEVRNDYVKAIKNVTFNEEFFNGHFPSEPVMPGVLQIEALAQTSCFLAYSNMQDEWTPNMAVLFTGIDKVRFRRKVIPGDQLVMEARLVNHKRAFWWLDVVGSVDGEVACQASLSAWLSSK